VKRDDAVRVLVLKGAGRTFSVGYDVSTRAEPITTVAGWREHALMGDGVCLKVWDLPKPVIAQLHGYCLGGACDLALTCDLAIAAEGTLIGEPEIRMSSNAPFPIMAWVIGIRKSKELLFTGDMIEAAEAHRIGLVNHVVPADQLEERVEKLATKLSRIAVPALQYAKATVNHAFELMGVRTGTAYGMEAFVQTQSTLTPERAEFNRIRDEQGLRAALRWRASLFEGLD
jgi:enoyl-CoA hydratase/carnithine racemase